MNDATRHIIKYLRRRELLCQALRMFNWHTRVQTSFWGSCSDFHIYQQKLNRSHLAQRMDEAQKRIAIPLVMYNSTTLGER